MRLRPALRTGLAFVTLCALGCGATFIDPLGRQQSLEDAQKKYTELIRWGEGMRASRYVDPDLRDRFLDVTKTLDDLHVTDFDVSDIEYEEDGSASVVVVYYAYPLDTLVEKSFRERQEWYRDGLRNQWHVRSDLEEAVASVVSP